MADATQVLTLLGDGYVRKNDKGELVLLAFQVDKDGQDVPVGSAADPLYMVFAEGTEVSIENGTFNYDIRKVGQVNVGNLGAQFIDAVGDGLKGVPSNSVLYGLYDPLTQLLPVNIDEMDQFDDSRAGIYTINSINAVAGQAVQAVPTDGNGFFYGYPVDGTAGPMFMTASTLYAYSNEAGDVEIVQTLDGDSAYSPNNQELLVRNNSVAIAGNEIANQSNAPGSMPSATLSGFGDPIGSTFIGSSFWLDTASALFASDGTPLSANTGTFPYDNSLYELLVANDVVAVGGVALSPANNLAFSGVTLPYSELIVPSVSAFGAAVFDNDSSPYVSTLSGTSDNGSIWAADSAVKIWGNAGVSDAVALGNNQFDLDTPLYAPVTLSMAAGLDATSNKMLALYSDYGALWINPTGGQVGDTFGNQTTAAPFVGGYVDGAGKVQLGTQLATSNFTDTFTDATPGTTRNFTAQNYTWQTRSDDPTSVGLAYSITLENSIDGGATWEVLATKTEADVTSPKTTVSAHPGSIFRTNCGSLTLGLTATNVTASVLAAM